RGSWPRSHRRRKPPATRTSRTSRGREGSTNRNCESSPVEADAFITCRRVKAAVRFIYQILSTIRAPRLRRQQVRNLARTATRTRTGASHRLASSQGAVARLALDCGKVGQQLLAGLLRAFRMKLRAKGTAFPDDRGEINAKSRMGH